MAEAALGPGPHRQQDAIPCDQNHEGASGIARHDGVTSWHGRSRMDLIAEFITAREATPAEAAR